MRYEILKPGIFQSLLLTLTVGVMPCFAAASLSWSNYMEQGQKAFAEGKWQEAKTAFSSALKEAEKTPADPMPLANSFSWLAFTYKKQNDFPQAESALLKAIAALEKTKEQKELTSALVGLAGVYINQNKTSEAESAFKRALALAKTVYPAADPYLANLQKGLDTMQLQLSVQISPKLGDDFERYLARAGKALRVVEKKGEKGDFSYKLERPLDTEAEKELPDYKESYLLQVREGKITEAQMLVQTGKTPIEKDSLFIRQITCFIFVNEEAALSQSKDFSYLVGKEVGELVKKVHTGASGPQSFSVPGCSKEISVEKNADAGIVIKIAQRQESSISQTNAKTKSTDQTGGGSGKSAEAKE